jgi:hypothetical protein
LNDSADVHTVFCAKPIRIVFSSTLLLAFLFTPLFSANLNLTNIGDSPQARRLAAHPPIDWIINIFPPIKTLQEAPHLFRPFVFVERLMA